jgi:hypothetical protein
VSGVTREQIQRRTGFATSLVPMRLFLCTKQLVSTNCFDIYYQNYLFCTQVVAILALIMISTPQKAFAFVLPKAIRTTTAPYAHRRHILFSTQRTLVPNHSATTMSKQSSQSILWLHTTNQLSFRQHVQRTHLLPFSSSSSSPSSTTPSTLSLSSTTNSDNNHAGNDSKINAPSFEEEHDAVQAARDARKYVKKFTATV